MITTTLKDITRSFPALPFRDEIREKYPHLQYDEDFPLFDAIDVIGAENALELMWKNPSDQGAVIAQKFALWCARQVQHLLEDERSKNALDVLERHIKGLTSREEVQDAYDAAVEVEYNCDDSHEVNTAIYAILSALYDYYHEEGKEVIVIRAAYRAAGESIKAHIEGLFSCGAICDTLSQRIAEEKMEFKRAEKLKQLLNELTL